jgi:hydroxymethylpyrimidine pyrophosphatase-like HAD family hydrolase
MALTTEHHEQLQRFFADSRFCEAGGVVTDLDGTALHEADGRVFISQRMEQGLKRMQELGRPVMIDTLRFPISVLSNFADHWYRVTGAPVPLVTLKGSQTGRIVPGPDGELVFEEHDAVVLDGSEIDELLRGVQGLLESESKGEDLLVFHYARDWRRGERIWTPSADRVTAVQDKFRSAAEVFSGPFEHLRDELHAREYCMVFLLIDAPNDRLMAYQHTQRSSFFTHQGVSKRDGAARLATELGIELAHSLGAGDAETDDFLADVGLAVVVGNQNLDYKGLQATLRVADSQDLGDLLFALGRHLQQPT